MNNNEWIYINNMGNPKMSGHYEVLISGGINEDYIEKDDYTTVQKIWWNSNPIAWRCIN